MNIFFDVDYTLITWDVKLRPGVREVFAKLREEGHTIYLWSGVGPRWEVVRRFELHEHVTDCFWKPLYDHHARLGELGITVMPDFVIDDHLGSDLRVLGHDHHQHLRGRDHAAFGVDGHLLHGAGHGSGELGQS